MLTVPLAIPLLLAFLTGISVAAETWRGIVVAPEHRCSPYAADDYSYSPSLEARIVSGLSGKVYGPYTGRCFSSSQDTDIEHIVARSEAHDSGLCAADAETRRRFARDLLNLTLANPRVNRHEKRGKDAAEWLPNLNQCWFAARIVEVRRKYDLTIDRREAEALERVLSACRWRITNNALKEGLLEKRKCVLDQPDRCYSFGPRCAVASWSTQSSSS